MHSLNHGELARASQRSRPSARARFDGRAQPQAPPGLRRGIARVLVAAAQRLDHEAARRAVA